MIRTPRPTRRSPYRAGTVTPTGGDAPVPVPVIQDAWQDEWNTVRVRVRSEAPH